MRWEGEVAPTMVQYPSVKAASLRPWPTLSMFGSGGCTLAYSHHAVLRCTLAYSHHAVLRCTLAYSHHAVLRCTLAYSHHAVLRCTLAYSHHAVLRCSAILSSRDVLNSKAFGYCHIICQYHRKNNSMVQAIFTG